MRPTRNARTYTILSLLFLFALISCAALPSPALASFPGTRGSVATDVLDLGRDIRNVTTEVSLTLTGFGHIDAGNFDTAQSCFKTGFLNGEKTGNSFLQALSLLGFGRLQTSRAQHAAALESYDRAIALFSRETGKQRRLLARAYTDKASLLIDTGDPGGASAALDAAYAIVKAEKNTALRQDVVYNIARLYLFLGNTERARILHNRTKNLRARILGPRHPSVAQSCLRTGEILMLTKSYPEARSHFNEAASILEAAYGKESHITAEAYFDIGRLDTETGDFPAALLFLQRAMDIQEKTLGRMHPAHAATSAELGMLYLATDHYDNALNALLHALDADTAASGANSLPAARDHIYLGDIYREHMVLHSSIENLSKALEIQTTILGDAHPELARTLNSLAASFFYDAQYDKAFDSQRKALKIDLETQEPKPDEDAEIAGFNNLGLLTHKTGKPADAIPHYLAALDVQKQSKHPSPLVTASLQHNLAAAYEASGDDKSALAAYTQSLTLMRWALGLDTTSTAANYTAPLDNRTAGDKYTATEGNQYIADEHLSIADIQLRLDNSDEAEKNYKSFLRLTYPDDPRAERVINILRLMGRWYDPEPTQKPYLPLSKPDYK